MTVKAKDLDRYRLLRLTDHKFILEVGDGRNVGSLGEFISPEAAMRALGWFTERDDIPMTCDYVDWRYGTETIQATPITSKRWGHRTPISVS